MCDLFRGKRPRSVKTKIELLRNTFEIGYDTLPTDMMGMLKFIETKGP